MSPELTRRWISAAIMMPIALFVVWQGEWWLAAGCAVLAGLMMYEWRNMSGQPQSVIFIICTGLCCLSAPLGEVYLTLGLIASGTIASMFIERNPRGARYVSAIGFVYVVALASSLYWLRDGPWNGLIAALLFMSFVWASDAAAFFGGRALGGPKLLPSESPNKTWSGSLSGIGATMLCGLAASFLIGGSVIVWILAGAAVSIFAQTGDMIESAAKRRFGVKDSSAIIPGHGGVLDRVDGLGAACLFMAGVLHLVPQLIELLALDRTIG